MNPLDGLLDKGRGEREKRVKIPFLKLPQVSPCISTIF
jgi:hypothetical protein